MKNYRCYAYYLNNDKTNTVYDYNYISNYFEINTKTITAKCIQDFGRFIFGQIYKIILTDRGYEIIL
jgi:hypothetical protein